jgi:hypothetical protein
MSNSQLTIVRTPLRKTTPMATPSVITGVAPRKSSAGVHHLNFIPDNWVNIIIALAAVATAVFTWKTVRSSQSSAEAARQSADAAQKTLEVAERPWLGVSHAGVKFEWRQPRPHFLVNVKNFGSLPAYLRGHRLNCCLTEDRLPPDPAFAGLIADAGIINPDESRRLEFPSPMSAEEYDRWRNGEGRLFVWFEINYDDPFGKSHCFAGVLAADGIDPMFRWWPNAEKYIRSS